jgi:hypothetical protein
VGTNALKRAKPSSYQNDFVLAHMIHKIGFGVLSRGAANAHVILFLAPGLQLESAKAIGA